MNSFGAFVIQKQRKQNSNNNRFSDIEVGVRCLAYDEYSKLLFVLG